MADFHNWARTHTGRPTAWHQPASEAEVREVLVGAREAGRRVRAVGSGHSWSAIAVPAEETLDLSRLCQVRSIDATTRRVVVDGGTPLHVITRALDEVGLAMPILGSISQQTIAGAIATGTHGSSLRYGNLASLVRALRLVTPKGDVLSLGPDDPRLDATRVSLGALGVVTQVELEVTTAFRLIESVELLAPERVAAELPSIGASAPFVKVWWLPHTGPMHVFRYAPSSLPADESELVRFVDAEIVNPWVFPAVLRLARAWPALSRPVQRAVARGYLDRPRAPIARSDHAFNVAMPPLHDETEWALDLPAAADVLAALVREVEREGWAIDFPLEIRFVRADAAWMSPAYGRDTVQIGAYATTSADQRAYFETFGRLARARGGRPHWGKECTFDAAYVERVMPRLGDFRALRDELDPTRVLENPYLRAVLGDDQPTSRSSRAR